MPQLNKKMKDYVIKSCDYVTKSCDHDVCTASVMVAYERIVAFCVSCGSVADSSDRRLLSSKATAVDVISKTKRVAMQWSRLRGHLQTKICTLNVIVTLLSYPPHPLS